MLQVPNRESTLKGVNVWLNQARTTLRTNYLGTKEMLENFLPILEPGNNQESFKIRSFFFTFYSFFQNNPKILYKMPFLLSILIKYSILQKSFSQYLIVFDEIILNNRNTYSQKIQSKPV